MLVYKYGFSGVGRKFKKIVKDWRDESLIKASKTISDQDELQSSKKQQK
jgi:hypothetical protein